MTNPTPFTFYGHTARVSDWTIYTRDLKPKNEAKKNKQKGKVQNIAYIGAMRELQDNFYEKVAMRSGLTRLDLLALVILVRCGKQSNRMPKH